MSRRRNHLLVHKDFKTNEDVSGCNRRSGRLHSIWSADRYDHFEALKGKYAVDCKRCLLHVCAHCGKAEVNHVEIGDELKCLFMETFYEPSHR